MKGIFLPLLRLIFVRFLGKTLWIALFSTFCIQLLLTFLPPQRVIDPRDSEKIIVREWNTQKYIAWVQDVFKGDGRVSDLQTGSWLRSEFQKRTVNTLVLCLSAFLAAAMMGIFTGTFKAGVESENIYGQGKPILFFFSATASALIFLFSSIPAYIIAFCLFLFFKSESSMFLAVIALTLGSGTAMEVLRFTANTHSRELRAKYVENALVCGLKTSGLVPLPGSVSWHAFRNSLMLILPVTAYRLPLIVSSALVVEVVFDLPGLGESLLISLIQQDVPAVLTIILISVLFVQCCIFCADMLAFILHPKKYSV